MNRNILQPILVMLMTSIRMLYFWNKILKNFTVKFLPSDRENDRDLLVDEFCGRFV